MVGVKVSTYYPTMDDPSGLLGIKVTRYAPTLRRRECRQSERRASLPNGCLYGYSAGSCLIGENESRGHRLGTLIVGLIVGK